jgi:aspartokinase-like uncharacterized kinase
MVERPIVVKLGGSLLSLPHLGKGLRCWLDSLQAQVILVVGGGDIVDVIRKADRLHRLGEETSHWLAVRGMSLQSHLVAALLPQSQVVRSLDACCSAWAERLTPILDPLSFLQEDEKQEGHLPHLWTVTSDSIAARVAIRANTRKLVLLKSCPMPAGSWVELAASGIVDAWFPQLVPLLAEIEVVDFPSRLATVDFGPTCQQVAGQRQHPPA